MTSQDWPHLGGEEVLLIGGPDRQYDEQQCQGEVSRHGCVILLVPRLCLPPAPTVAGTLRREAESRGSPFPGRAWERGNHSVFGTKRTQIGLGASTFTSVGSRAPVAWSILNTTTVSEP